MTGSDGKALEVPSGEQANKDLQEAMQKYIEMNAARDNIKRNP